MDAISDPSIREVWVMKSAQVGWTEILNNVVGFHVDQDPAPILMVQPTLEMAEAYSKDRLAPMVRDTPALRDRIADPKSRDSGNTLLHKNFAGGHISIAGANSPSGLASRPIRIVLFDEVDRYPASAGAEGDPVSLGKKRAATFWNRKVLAGSTPTIKGSSRIEAGFEASDQRFYFVPCVHCGEMQRLIWAQVRWPDDAPEVAVYVCKGCGTEITDRDKAEMLRHGEWRSTRPSKGIAGFHISELYSPWSTFGEMAVAFLRAKKFPETFQTWINTALGETWEDKGETLDATSLLGRRESYTSQSLPPAVRLLTAGVDVQDDRLEATVWGWGEDEEAFRVEHLVLRGDPGSPSLWADLDALFQRRWRTDDARELAIEASCVDSGGHYTEQVYQYASRRKRQRIWAIKGVGGQGRLVWPKRPSRGGKHRVDVWAIGVDTIKDLLYGRLKRVSEPGPGYVHFDADTDEVWFDQLVSETVVYRIVQGRRVRLWKPRQTGIRQEALDCAVYAYAAMVGRGGSKILNKRGAPAVPHAPMPPDDGPSGPPPPAPEPAPRAAPQRSGWVTRRNSWMRR